MCQNPERSQLRLSYVAIGNVYYHSSLWNFSVPIHSVANDLLGCGEEKPIPLLVGNVPILDDCIRDSFYVSFLRPSVAC